MCPSRGRQLFRLVVGLLILGALIPLYASPQEPATNLEARIAEILKVFQAEAGIYFENPEGRVFSWNAEESFHAASTMKVPVMMEVFHQVEIGRLRLDEPLTIRNRFRSIQDNSFYTLKRRDDSDAWIYSQPGRSMTVRGLVERMINRSSNLATNLLLQRISTSSVRDLMTSIDAGGMNVMRGLEDKKAFDAGRNNTTSARALGVCLKAILDPVYFQAGSRQAMLDILFAQHFNNGIPKGIRASQRGFKIAHKTGSIHRISHDAAIIEDTKGNRSILVILTRGVPDEKRGEALVAKLAGEIATFLHLP